MSAVAILVSLGASSLTRAEVLPPNLFARDLDGNSSTVEAYYDSALHITWLQNANFGAGSLYDDGKFNNDGRMTLYSALDWVDHLTVGSVSGWRLPTMIDTGQPGCSGEFSFTGGSSCGQNVFTTPGVPNGSGGYTTNASEMAYMFQLTLGNNPACVATGTPSDTCGATNPKSPSGSWLLNTGPFSGIGEAYNAVWYGSAACSADPRNCRDDAFWTNVGIANDPYSAFKFLFGEGEQIGDSRFVEFFAWAVHDGDVGTAITAVPLPASFWLLATGLLGLGVTARRHRPQELVRR